jgi:hypothetical protein
MLERVVHVLTVGSLGITAIDPWLSPFKDSLKRRFAKSQEWIEKIEATEGGLDKFSKVSRSFFGGTSISMTEC